MKVILTGELKGRGGEGDVIDVARGFAVNYLLPKGIAIEATPGNLKQLEQRMHNIKKRESARVAGANEFLAGLDGKSITITVKVGEEGRLFGSVTAPMIAAAIAEQLGVEVDRRKIELHGHIKEVGQYPFSIAIYREIKANLTVNVVADVAVEAAVEAEVVAEEAAEEIVEEAIAEGAEAAAASVDVTVDAATGEVEAVEAEVETAE